MNNDRTIEYLSTPLRYKNGVLTSNALEGDLCSIMDNQEDLIMEKSAEVLFKNKPKSVLNIGHGLGIIDSYIKLHNPESHTIVDIHPDAVKFAKSKGFNQVVNMDWRNYAEICIQKGVKFDSIYFDTYNLNILKHEWIDFGKVVDSILNKGGIFCWFNGFAATHVDFTNRFGESKRTWKLFNETISIFDIMDRCRANGNTDFDPASLPAKNYKLDWFVKN